MNLKLAYLGRSALSGSNGSRTLSLSPNLSREPVAFEAPLMQPLRFREAISALHDVVINDLRFKPRDKTAYEEWKKREAKREGALRTKIYKEQKEEVLKRRQDVPPDLERDYKTKLRRYWKARQQYSNYLLRHDYDLWRRLMPCDPVITVADDVTFFECFSADESSYGCLTVQRERGFGRVDNVQFGTTNVDYSWDLYNHFQMLRSYRETRFRVDPSGFEVATEGSADYREEKIDLPDGWLRGFMMVQQAMALPMTKVTLSRESVYSLLAWLKRHKAKTSPRAVRFELLPGKPPAMVLEPWEKRIESTGTVYDGPPTEPIRIWGRDRLLVLSRLLPLVERFDVYLLGVGLPSFWVAQMGEMYLTLGLSGWTTNDWTAGSALDTMLPPADPSDAVIQRVSDTMQQRRAAPFADISSGATTGGPETLAALGHLAHTGQVIHDLSAGVYRWRQIMPRALGEAELGPESPELREGKRLAARRAARNLDITDLSKGARLVTGQVENYQPEILIDGDGRIKRGKCKCSHYYKYSFRNGPCRHMIAMHRAVTDTGSSSDSLNAWFNALQQRIG